MKKILPIITSVFTIFVASANAQLSTTLNSETKLNSLINTNSRVESRFDDDNLFENDDHHGSTTKEMNGTTSTTSTHNTFDSNHFMVNSFGVGINSSSQVKSNEDLEIFNWNQSIKDKDVDKVVISPNDSDETKIEVHYYNKGKLLGIIPVRIKSTTVVEAKPNSEIKVVSKLPWWSFLVKTEDYDKSELEASIKNSIKNESTTSLNVNAKERAEIAEKIIAKLEAQAKAKVSVNQ